MQEAVQSFIKFHNASLLQSRRLILVLDLDLGLVVNLNLILEPARLMHAKMPLCIIGACKDTFSTPLAHAKGILEHAKRMQHMPHARVESNPHLRAIPANGSSPHHPFDDVRALTHSLLALTWHAALVHKPQASACISADHITSPKPSASAKALHFIDSFHSQFKTMPSVKGSPWCCSLWLHSPCAAAFGLVILRQAPPLGS